MKNSTQPKTVQALALIDSGMTPAAAARKLEISESVVYRVVRKRDAEAAGVCSHCGAPVGADGQHRKTKK
jgi:hypothetical protein